MFYSYIHFEIQLDFHTSVVYCDHDRDCDISLFYSHLSCNSEFSENQQLVVEAILTVDHFRMLQSMAEKMLLHFAFHRITIWLVSLVV